MKKLSSQYWNQRYINQETQWDLGQVSTPLKTYIDQLSDTSIKILIPGAGNGHEVEYLFSQGFKNIYVLDISQIALSRLTKLIPDFPEGQIICTDFFQFNSKFQFDLILEQTFFCALNPKLRVKYVNKMSQLLKSRAKLVGVMFNFPLTENGPPFGGNETEYRNLFQTEFLIEKMEPCFNSDGNRQGKELFVMFRKP